MLIKKILLLITIQISFLFFILIKQTFQDDQTKQIFICLDNSKCRYELGIIAQTNILLKDVSTYN